MLCLKLVLLIACFALSLHYAKSAVPPSSSSPSHALRASPATKTDCGEVEGIWLNNNNESSNNSIEDEDMAVFYSIPYAAPPVGTQGRWKPPKKPNCWSGIYNATKSGNMCVQMFEETSETRPQSEDCLYLDVYTSFLDSETPAPVMVWIHGGSLIAGSSTSYTGLSNLAQSAGVVLVSMNYRLAAFGFLALEPLSGVDPRGVSGNYGILDQQLALQWVQENIHAFGGDPSRVTLIGQSSGGTSIFALLASPASNGLFHAAISLSGSPNLTISLGDAYIQNYNAVIQNSNCEGPSAIAVLSCLYDLTPAQVAVLFPAPFNVEPLLPSNKSGEFYPGLPIVDGVTLTKPLLEALQTGLVDVPVLFQVTLAEMDTFEPNETIYNMSTSAYESFLTGYLSARGWSSSTGSQVMSLYASELAQSTELGYQVFMSDYSFQCGTNELGLAAYQGFKSTAYVSIVVAPPSHPMDVFPGKPPCRYAAHMWDYICGADAWDFFTSSTNASVFTPEASDIQFGAMLVGMWKDMAHTLSISALASISNSSLPAGSYVVNVLGNEGVEKVLNYNAPRCSALAEELGLDQRFWLTN